MGFIFKSCLLLFLVTAAHFSSLSEAQELPTVYEYFREGGIQSGLIAGADREFRLNGKPLRIISGAIHYFRVHPSRWRDSLRKLRATGALAVETYVAWNIHEAERDVYDFGQGGQEWSEFADVIQFIKIAQEEDLLVLFRPGPYICAEYEFGGFPSWLLQDPDMRVRGSYGPYLERVKKFYDNLLPLILDLQFVNGGSIIGIQMENEYGYFDKADQSYIQFLVDIYRDLGFHADTLLYTSDSPFSGDRGTLEELLWTANFNNNPMSNLNELVRIQPNKPVMVMEYWSGWFDYWQGQHDTGLSDIDFRTNLDIILGHFNASVNFYMFHGGTNFGFMAGGELIGSGYAAVTTSYDYDAPLSEAGDYTEKYNVIVELIEQYGYPKLRKPVQPLLQSKEAYDTVQPQLYLTYEKILGQVPSTAKFHSEQPTHMEVLDMNGGSGQSNGLIIHRYHSTTATNGSLFKAGRVKDFATVVVDGQLQASSFSGEGRDRYWIDSEREIVLDINDDGGSSDHQIDLVIENMARLKLGSESDMIQPKGLPDGHIFLDGVELNGFDIFALEFKSVWIKNLTDFEEVGSDPVKAPVIIQSTFQVPGEPLDTFLDLSGWHKGLAFVNGFNLGRYFSAGPQQRLYVPAGVLQTGANTVTIFEQLEPGTEIKFKATPDFTK